MVSQNTVMKTQYKLLWSALLWTFFFGSKGFNFLLRMGLRCASFAGADAPLKRRKSGKCKKYLCKLENKDKSISFSVKPNFESDIKNIVNRLLHFHARQMDQRLGFSVTEWVLILKFGEWGPLFLGLKNTCTWRAWKGAPWASDALFRDLVDLMQTFIF